MNIRDLLKLIPPQQIVVVRYELKSVIKQNGVVYDQVEGSRTEVWRYILSPERLRVTAIEVIKNTLVITVDIIQF